MHHLRDSHIIRKSELIHMDFFDFIFLVSIHSEGKD